MLTLLHDLGLRVRARPRHRVYGGWGGGVQRSRGARGDARQRLTCNTAPLCRINFCSRRGILTKCLCESASPCWYVFGARRVRRQAACCSHALRAACVLSVLRASRGPAAAKFSASGCATTAAGVGYRVVPVQTGSEAAARA